MPSLVPTETSLPSLHLPLLPTALTAEGHFISLDATRATGEGVEIEVEDIVHGPEVEEGILDPLSLVDQDGGPDIIPDQGVNHGHGHARDQERKETQNHGSLEEDTRKGTVYLDPCQVQGQ